MIIICGYILSCILSLFDCLEIPFVADYEIIMLGSCVLAPRHGKISGFAVIAKKMLESEDALRILLSC